MVGYTTSVVIPGQATATSKRDQVTVAALRILGESGSRGFTHRAVDRAAGVPTGTTSNYFNSRSALLEAALKLHVELDTPPEAVLAEVPGMELSDEEALEVMLGVLERLRSKKNSDLLKARYELVLEASRDPQLHEIFEPARRRFVALAEALLAARGCRSPEQHAAQLVVVMDGALMDSLIGTSTSLDRDQLRDLLARQLDTC
jgi:DNA-binding transcriptional regulator YbjK